LVFSRNARIAPSTKVAYLHPDRTFQIQHKPRTEHQTCLNALPRCSLYYSNVKIILITYLIQIKQ
ncbi:MAG: hypothetical protein UDM12_01630, partial [Prevotellamassilia sp.]|nr:hypothetical protein [Prevotellamassilia sp.]